MMTNYKLLQGTIFGSSKKLSTFAKLYEKNKKKKHQKTINKF